MIRTRRIRFEPGGTRWLEVEGEGDPVLFVHGNPTCADDWRPFLEALDGKRRCIALDMLGWGESERVPDFEHTMDALTGYLLTFIDELEIDRYDLVAHDWGTGMGLMAAQRRPERVGRTVSMNGVVFDESYRWHWIARVWRRRGLGEVFNALTTKQALDLTLRQATPKPGSPPGVADLVWKNFDSGNSRAMLELYRSADEPELAKRGHDLGKLAGPNLVLWGDADPYLAPQFGDSLAERLNACVKHYPDAGHWPWLERPEIIDEVVDFLTQ